MRAVFVAALGILVLGMLSGCDLVHAPTPRTAAVAEKPCNCLPAPVEHLTRLAPPAVRYHGHRHHHRDVARNYGYSGHSYIEYSSPEMAQYEYEYEYASSSSVSSYSGSSYSSESQGGYAGYGETEEGYSREHHGYGRDDYERDGYGHDEYRHDEDARDEYWTDGYGRQHASGGDVTRTPGDSDARLDPWHGYYTDCPERDRE